ncbi:MAG: hypothetical protein ABSF76_11470 [Opitutaceae bacterium]
MKLGDFVVESKIKALVVGDPWLRDNGGIPCGKKGSRCGASPPELDAAAANQLILGNEADLVRKPEETRLTGLCPRRGRQRDGDIAVGPILGQPVKDRKIMAPGLWLIER